MSRIPGMKPASMVDLLRCWLVFAWALAFVSICSFAGAAGDLGAAGAKRPAGPGIKVDPLYVVYRHIDSGAFREPMGIAFDRKAGEIYVADTRNNVITIFNEEGAPLFSFDGVEEPRKVMVDEHGRIYVIDNEGRKGVKVFSYRGEFLRFFSFPGSRGKLGVIPVSMTIDQDGSLYFLDQANLKVLVYDREWRFIRAFGTAGKGPGKFMSLADIAVDRMGNIYVTDRRSLAVQVFDPMGGFLTGWGKHSFERHQFSLPNGIAVDRKGRVLVADTLRQDIKVFDQTGAFLGNFGGFGVRPGEVAYPIELETDGEGRIYLVEKVGQRFQVFKELN